jgi:hypothetical protein
LPRGPRFLRAELPGILAKRTDVLSRSYPHEPLVSYRINRQISGWILPQLMIRAFGAHRSECELV